MQQEKNNQEKQKYSDGSELIPAEVASRQERVGGEIPEAVKPSNEEYSTEGYTVSREGLINNYPVTPEMSKQEYPSEEKQRKYLIAGGIALLFVTALIFIAFRVS